MRFGRAIFRDPTKKAESAGVHGNTHFPFSDLNNKHVADLMSKFLAEKKLD